MRQVKAVVSEWNYYILPILSHNLFWNSLYYCSLNKFLFALFDQVLLLFTNTFYDIVSLCGCHSSKLLTDKHDLLLIHKNTVCILHYWLNKLFYCWMKIIWTFLLSFYRAIILNKIHR